MTGQSRTSNLQKFDVYFHGGKKATVEGQSQYVLPVRHSKVCVILPFGKKPLHWNWWGRKWQETKFVSWPRQFANWFSKTLEGI